VDLGLYNGQTTSAWDLNDDDIVTGASVENGINMPFLWEKGQYTPLGTLANLGAVAQAINSGNAVAGSGQVLVAVAGQPIVSVRGFLWTDKGIRQLDPLPGDIISSAGELSEQGFAGGISRPPYGIGIDKAVLWDDEGVHNLNALVALEPGFRLPAVTGFSSAGNVLAIGGLGGSGDHSIILSPIQRSPGDVDRNCRVNIDDLLFIINEWGQTDSDADLNHDEIVNVFDLIIVIENWTVLVAQPQLPRYTRAASALDAERSYA
jgi:hypothetical protein